MIASTASHVPLDHIGAMPSDYVIDAPLVPRLVPKELASPFDLCPTRATPIYVSALTDHHAIVIRPKRETSSNPKNPRGQTHPDHNTSRLVRNRVNKTFVRQNHA